MGERGGTGRITPCGRQSAAGRFSRCGRRGSTRLATARRHRNDAGPTTVRGHRGSTGRITRCGQRSAAERISRCGRRSDAGGITQCGQRSAAGHVAPCGERSGTGRITARRCRGGIGRTALPGRAGGRGTPGLPGSLPGDKGPVPGFGGVAGQLTQFRDPVGQSVVPRGPRAGGSRAVGRAERGGQVVEQDAPGRGVHGEFMDDHGQPDGTRSRRTAVPGEQAPQPCPGVRAERAAGRFQQVGESGLVGELPLHQRILAARGIETRAQLGWAATTFRSASRSAPVSGTGAGSISSTS